VRCGKDDYRSLFPECAASGTDLWHYTLLGTTTLSFAGEWFAFDFSPNILLRYLSTVSLYKLFQNPLTTPFWSSLPKVLGEASSVPPRAGSKRAKQTKKKGFETTSSHRPGISYRKDKGPAKIMRLITQRAKADIRTVKVALPLVR